jgi:uncharacterized membrane protein (UPF0127 family)
VNLLILLALAFSFSTTVPLSKKQISVKGKSIWVEVADDDRERQQGLMYRRSLGADEGMLFIFPKEDNLSFWMRNTFIPLSIAYFTRDGILVDLHDMQPFGEKPGDPPTYRSVKPAQYALEMNLGWFKKNKIGLGSKLVIH